MITDNELIRQLRDLGTWAKTEQLPVVAYKAFQAADRLEELTRARQPQIPAAICPECGNGWQECQCKPQPQSPPPGTVRVRVTVAVDQDGWWTSEGGSDWSSDEAQRMVSDQTSDSKAIYWLTADLPLPTIPEIPARVEAAKP